MRVLTSIITKLEKLQEARMYVMKIAGIQQWNKTLWNQQKNWGKQLSFGDNFFGFQRAINHTQGVFLGNGWDYIKYNIFCEITLCYW